MRKFLALVLSFILSASAVSVVANAARFTDVPASDETLTKAVDLLSSVGITTGTTETTFGTTEKVTRQQMATFIYRLMKAGKTVEGGDNSTSFTDLEDPFYYFMISWANDMGIIKGRNETTFDPKGGIILQDAYVMIVRALGYEKKKALAYPFDYIEIAEDIGLDEGLSSTVSYDTALTRGDVAVLLYNAFYADMAAGKTGYRPIYETVDVDGELQIVEIGQEPYTVYDTVAENIFAVKRTVQRVVATPNYCLDDNQKTDNGKEDEVMITVKCFDEDYIETDSQLFGTIDFASLGLPGNADDYFLLDLSIYYRQEENKSPEIISASSLGTYKKQISGNNIKFEQGAGTVYDNIAYQSDGNFRPATGKVTIDGQVNYLFNAPWSYSKPANMADKDKECITLLWLDKTERDPESEEYVMDFNFKAHRDVLGRGREQYDAVPNIYKKEDGKWVKISESMVDSDLRGHGIYSMGGMISLMQINFNSKNFEADAWDSNSDGKYDYLWLKPYTVGQVSIDEGSPLMDMHATDLDAISAVYAAGEVPTIYTYGAVTEGVEFKDGQLITGYINGPANYVKVATATAMTYTTDQVYDKDTSSTNFGFNGSSAVRSGLSRQYVGVPKEDGSKADASVPGGLPFFGGHNYNLIKDHFGEKFDIVFVDNAMFHVKATKSLLNSGEDYAIIFPNNTGSSAYTTAVGIVQDGNLRVSGHTLDVMVGGEISTVLVKPQTSAKVASENTVTYETIGENGAPDTVSTTLMPVTGKTDADTYDFSDYVGKLLTYTVNGDDEYTFKIAPLASNSDKSVLQGEDEDKYYTFEADEYGQVSAAFVKSTGNLYQFVKANSSELQTKIAPSKYVSLTENTKVVIKTLDDEGEPKFSIYDYYNKPNFDNSDDLYKIKYIVKNNPKSTSIEELIYLYAEAASGDTGVKIGNTLDFRFVKSVKTVRKEDSTVLYYDVYNPFKANVEEEYETYSGETAPLTTYGIYSLSGGYINDKNLMGRIDQYGNLADSSTTKSTTGLGLVELGAYDKDNKLLTIESDGSVCLVDDKTVVSFLDLDNGTIEKKTADILSSASGNYRCNDNKKMPLLAFVATSEIKKVDEYEYAEAICIVRLNSLDTTETDSE